MKNTDEIQKDNSYSKAVQKLEGNTSKWELFFKQKINPICTKVAEEATKKVYPNYVYEGKMTDTMTRTWYHAYMAEYQKQIEEQTERMQDLSLREKALIAYETRHHARVQTRSQMEDLEALQKIQNWDLKRYNNKDGPTFDWLMKKNMKEGMTEEESYQEILKSALTTNMWVNMYINACKSTESVSSYASSIISSISNFVSETVTIIDIKGLSIDITEKEIEQDLFKPH